MSSEVVTQDEALRQQIREELRAEYSKQLAEEVTKINAENKKMMEEAIEEWQGKQKPPTNEELEKLLSQEYITFPVKVRAKGIEKEFTISELPQSIERKFFKKFKERLTPKINELAELTVKIAEGEVERKITSILEMFEPALDILSDATLLVLNPFGKDEEVTLEWVQENIPSFRQWNIVLAQERVNRLRDFFLQASVASQGPKGMTGVGSQL